jgi:hypothetical protein
MRFKNKRKRMRGYFTTLVLLTVLILLMGVILFIPLGKPGQNHNPLTAGNTKSF